MATPKKAKKPRGPYHKNTPPGHLALGSWPTLNKYLLATSDERVCQTLLDLEKGGRNRKNFLLRIHSRLNHLRAARERRTLVP